MIVTLVRHGESQLNATGHFAGWIDTDLTASGKEQLKSIHLPRRTYDLAVSSDLLRSRDSLNVLLGSGLVHAPVVVADIRMRERTLGSLDGSPRHVLSYRDRLHASLNGESIREFASRVLHFLHNLAVWANEQQSNEGVQVLIVGHAGTMRIVDGIANGELRIDQVLSPAAPNAGVCTYEFAQVAPPTTSTEYHLV